MKKDSKDKGIIFMVLERFNKQRLPRALDLKKRVDSGELLSEFDHQFLKEVFADANRIKPLVDRNPEYKELYEKAYNLWKGIIDKDLENQKKS